MLRREIKMKQHTCEKKFRKLAATGVFALGAVVVLLAGCASHYRAAMRELSLSPERRLAIRVDAMEQSAARALRAVENAAEASRTGLEPRPASAAARRVRLVNEAEAAVFEYSRQILIVEDVLAQAHPASPGHLDPLRISMVAAEESLAAALDAIRARDGGQVASRDDRGGVAGARSLSLCLARAETHVGAVARDARATMARDAQSAGAGVSEGGEPAAGRISLAELEPST